jgi:hypothetical protein
MRRSPRADRPRELYVPAVGQTVRVRPVPRKLLAKAAGDVQELMVWKLVYGVVDPQLTEAEARAITTCFTPRTLQPIVDLIDELSGTDEHLRLRFDARVPTRVRPGVRAAVMADASLARRQPPPHTTARRDRRLACPRPRRRALTRASSRSADSGDLADEPPLAASGRPTERRAAI